VSRLCPRRWGRWLVLSLVLVGVGGAAAGEESPPAQVVRRLHDAYTSVLREAKTLPYQGRYERLAPAIKEAFDLAFMARAVIGREWNQLSQDDQARWVKAFTDFTIANYAARLDHDSGQRFEFLGEQPGENDTVMVMTRVVDPAAENVNLNYRLRQASGGWRIIDLYAKGTVSELALRRSEYASLIKSSGVEALIASLRRKVEDLAAGKTVD